MITLLFVTSALLVGAAMRQLLKSSRIPYTVALLLIGLGVGFLERSGLAGSQDSLLSQTVAIIAAIDPLLILFIFLPTLIFESAFAIETHLFRRAFPQIAILAVPGLLISTVLTAVLVKTVFPWDWNWPLALLFGALVSATDPVAVVALLKEMSSRKRLETLIEGESLLNDGTAIVLFTLFLGMLTVTGGGEVSPLAVLGQFSRVVLAGFAIGLLFGWLTILWIGRVFNDPLIEISLSIATAYLVFYIAEGALHVSGVVALVTLGILFASAGRTRVSPEVASFLHHFWEMMAYMANTLIFLLVGILIAKRVQLDDPQAWTALGVLYLGIMVIRALSISLLMPLLRRIGLGFGRDKAIVLIWGGLRGAVALALALSVAQSGAIPREIGDQILFLCAGIVVLTILINGGSFSVVLNRLGLDRLPAAKQATVDKAERSLQRDLDIVAQQIQTEELLSHADWPAIHQDIALRRTRYASQATVAGNIEQEDLLVASKRRILEAERKHYWQQFAQGTLSSQATTLLVSAVEDALDGEPEVYPRQGLEKYRRLSEMAARLTSGSGPGKWLRRITGDRVRLSYEISRGFLLAQQDSKAHLQRLAPTQVILQQIEQDILWNIADASRDIASFRQQFPDVAANLETRVANRRLLNRRRKLIDELAAKGVLDTPEAERMTSEVEQQMALLDKRPGISKSRE